MDKKNRPRGRQKKVGRGSASVSKRGSGIGRKTGPVGGSSQKMRRRTKPSTGSYNLPSGSGSLPKMNWKTILIIGIVVFFAYRFLMGGGGNSGSGIDNGLSGLLNDTLENTTDTSGSMTDTYSDTGSYPVDTSVVQGARAKYTTPVGGGQDQVTLMVYMLGTDLESRSGMATADLAEMTKASISDQVNLIVETGGTKTWKNSIISHKTNQRYKVVEGGLNRIEDNLGQKNMVDPDTLVDFISYSVEAYPADRYQLILWDHGGGSLTGFGYDELNPGDHMDLGEIKYALDKAGVKFDFIGFDACLMGTLETALMLEPYADYMIASEELEPGIGWYYTEWLTALSDNTSIPTTSLGKKLIDDYVAEVARAVPRSQATLSLIDLAELKATSIEPLEDFGSATSELLSGDQYQIVSNARAGAKEFAKKSKINQIDLIHFAETMATDEGERLAEALKGAVKYNRTSDNISNANGLSVYFPYDQLNKVGEMLETYEEIGMDDAYSDAMKRFASMAAGGQMVAQSSGSSGNLLGSLLGQGSGASSIGADVIGNVLSGGLGSILGGGSDWADQETVEASTDFFAENQLEASDLKISVKDGQRVLALTEKQWSVIQTMEMNVFIDDGQGFIDLGLDNVYEWNDDGDLIMDYDGTWLTMDGYIVAYYMVSEDTSGDRYTIQGRVPAMLNDERVDIILQFDDLNPYGSVLGAAINYDPDQETPTLPKGYIDIIEGDKLEFLCDYYTYSGDYSDTYYLGNPYTFDGSWTIENLDISQYSYQMAYRVRDIYNNYYWTDTVSD